MEPKKTAIIAAVVVGVLALPLVLAGGANKITVENYNKIQMGMSYDQVKAILGSGDRKTFKEMVEESGQSLPPMLANIEEPPGIDNYIWEKGDEEGIYIMFVNGAVQMKGHEGIAEEPAMEMGDMQALMQTFMPAGMPEIPPEVMQQMQQQMQNP